MENLLVVSVGTAVEIRAGFSSLGSSRATHRPAPACAEGMRRRGAARRSTPGTPSVLSAYNAWPVAYASLARYGVCDHPPSGRCAAASSRCPLSRAAVSAPAHCRPSNCITRSSVLRGRWAASHAAARGTRACHSVRRTGHRRRTRPESPAPCGRDRRPESRQRVGDAMPLAAVTLLWPPDTTRTPRCRASPAASSRPP